MSQICLLPPSLPVALSALFSTVSFTKTIHESLLPAETLALWHIKSICKGVKGASKLKQGRQFRFLQQQSSKMLSNSPLYERKVRLKTLPDVNKRMTVGLLHPCPRASFRNSVGIVYFLKNLVNLNTFSRMKFKFNWPRRNFYKSMAGLEKSFVSTTPTFLVTSHIINVKYKASYRFKRAFLIQQRTRAGTHTHTKKKTSLLLPEVQIQG